MIKLLLLKSINALSALKMSLSQFWCFVLSYHSVYYFKESLVLGFLNPEFWVLHVIFYGTASNGLFSFILLFDNWTRMAKGEIAPINKYAQRILLLKPFVAGIACFMLFALWSVVFKGKSFIGLNLTGEEGEIVIGIISGFFAEYWLNKDYVQELFQRLNKRLFKK